MLGTGVISLFPIGWFKIAPEWVSEHEKRRDITWGTYGKEGKDPVRFVLVKNLGNNHVENIISHMKEANEAKKIQSPSMCPAYGEGVISFFNKEKEYRELKNIYIKETL